MYETPPPPPPPSLSLLLPRVLRLPTTNRPPPPSLTYILKLRQATITAAAAVPPSVPHYSATLRSGLGRGGVLAKPSRVPRRHALHMLYEERQRKRNGRERGRGRDFLSLNGNRHVPARPTPARARPPARPRVVRWGCAAGHAAECGEHTARSPDRRPRLCLNIWARNDTKWAGGRRNGRGIPKKEAGLARAESEVIERRRSAIPVVYCRGFALAFEGESRVCSVFLSVCLSLE